LFPHRRAAEVLVFISKCFSRRALLRSAGLVAITAAASWPITGRAQVVRGVVVDEGSGRALPGIVVVLLDSAGKRLAGVLADDAGRYAIRIASPGSYGIRAERVGYRADTPTAVKLAAGETVELRLVTRPVPVMLSTVRVTGTTACVARASDGQDVSAVWDEARKALYATDLTQRNELFTAKVSRFERTIDARDAKVTSYSVKQTNGVTRNPFVSLPAAQLSASGFARQVGSETIYYGPDAGVLLSDEFLGDHCFKLREAGGRRSAMIGIEFEPARGRTMPEIAGTLWLDRKTAELRDLEYAYRGLPNLPSSVRSEDFGGRVEFQRMPTGAWIVQRWVIRMPLLVDKGPLATRSEGVIPGGVSTRPERVQLAAIREEGGEVVETVARGERRENATEASTVRGIVFDSTRMEPLPNARVFFDGTQFSARTDASGRFTIERVPPGTYSLGVMHARFDSLQLRPPTATVVMRAGEATTAELAAPSNATIFARDCAPEDRRVPMTALRGYVRDGTTGAPAIDAKVTMTWNRLVSAAAQPTPVVQEQAGTRTDSAGRFAFCGLPAGVRLTARAATEERRSPPQVVLLPENQIAVAEIVVGTQPVVASLAPTRVETSPAPQRSTPMREFDRRRRRGSGTFLTRAQIERSHATRLTDLFRVLPGVSVTTSDNGAPLVELRGTKRITMDSPAPTRVVRTDSGGAPPPPLTPSTGEMTVKRCPAGFLLDGLPIDGAGLDLGMNAETVEAIEVYPGAQVPIEYAGRHSECGLIMIWTRAFADRPTPETGRDGQR
jgi:hypothetical protein